MANDERTATLPKEPTDAMCHAGVEVIKKAMAGKGAPFEFPNIEHLYDVWAAMVRAHLEQRLPKRRRR